MSAGSATCWPRSGSGSISPLRRRPGRRPTSPMSRRAPGARCRARRACHIAISCLALPGFLVARRAAPTGIRSRSALALTGHFLAPPCVRAAGPGLAGRAVALGRAHAARGIGLSNMPALESAAPTPLRTAYLTSIEVIDVNVRAAAFRRDPQRRFRRRARRALSVLRAVDDHVALAAGCARRAEAGASPHPARDAAAAPRSRPRATRNAPASSAT